MVLSSPALCNFSYTIHFSFFGVISSKLLEWHRKKKKVVPIRFFSSVAINSSDYKIYDFAIQNS